MNELLTLAVMAGGGFLLRLLSVKLYFATLDWLDRKGN